MRIIILQSLLVLFVSCGVYRQQHQVKGQIILNDSLKTPVKCKIERYSGNDTLISYTDINGFFTLNYTCLKKDKGDNLNLTIIPLEDKTIKVNSKEIESIHYFCKGERFRKQVPISDVFNQLKIDCMSEESEPDFIFHK